VYFDAASLKALTTDSPSTYVLFNPTGAQSCLNIQVWSAALTSAQALALHAWGRPPAELGFYVPPTDTKNTNAAYKLYNIPGETEALLRLLLSDATQAYDKFRIGIRPLRIQTTTLWECESGTLGTDVTGQADATASGGNVARFTPTATTYGTRVTVTVAADPDDVAPFYGEYRLLLAGKDDASATGINTIKFRTVVGGVNGDYSTPVSMAAVSTYSLLDLGTLTVPPGAWPEETEDCTSDVHAGSYFQIEICTANSVGAAGGTLDMDALYLQPVELEGVVENSALTTAQFQVMDFISEPPAQVAVADARTLEFAGWGDYVGDRLMLPPVCGDAGLALLHAYRDTAEASRANDAVTVYWFVAPRWG
jgi:hypothetical protein